MVVPLIINALTQRRISGGGFVANTPVAPCPEPGSGTGSFTVYADQVFASPLVSLGLPSDVSGVPGETAIFGPPDTVGWVWEDATVPDGVGSAGIGFTLPECDALNITGGTVMVNWADANAINVGLVCSDGVDVLYTDSVTAAFGPGSLSLTLDAAQATGLADGWYSVAVVSDGASDAARIEWDSVTFLFNYTA